MMRLDPRANPHPPRRTIPVTAESAARPDRAVGVQVITRAAEILRLLRAAPGGLSQAEISERIGLARTTVHRILGALESEELVVSGPRARFRLGPEIPRLAEAARYALVIDMRVHLEKLSRELNETVDLSVLERDHVTFVDQVVAPHRLRAVSAVGASFPAHSSANGKALLAELDDATLTRIAPTHPEPLTANTVRTRTALIAQLAEIRRTGVAYDREEHTVGISAAGAVVHGPWGTAAISVPMPTQRFAGREDELATALRETIESISTGSA
jgi:DNA-binding IclR family transcriptional regulator